MFNIAGDNLFDRRESRVNPVTCLTEHCVFACKCSFFFIPFFLAFMKLLIIRDYLKCILASSLLKNMDLTADPCEDFYQYACGNWANHNPLPDDKSSYDAFNKLRDDLQVIMRGIIIYL